MTCKCAKSVVTQAGFEPATSSFGGCGPNRANLPTFRQYGVDILLTRAVQQTLDSRFKLRELPPTEVRGVADPVAIFAAAEFDG